MTNALIEKVEKVLQPAETKTNTYYVQLLKQIQPKPVSNDKTHKVYVQLIEKISEIVIAYRDMKVKDAVTLEVLEGAEEFIKLLAELVEHYEKQVFPSSGTSPIQTLRFLMKQHALKQSDLSAELGGQSVVSDILNGKRMLHPEQMIRLGKRFGVSPATFLDAA
jgi:antitoxin component HigA of HigAB toxin-antitoxin module